MRNAFMQHQMHGHQRRQHHERDNKPKGLKDEEI
jgi:hypothetical protein